MMVLLPQHLDAGWISTPFRKRVAGRPGAMVVMDRRLHGRYVPRYVEFFHHESSASARPVGEGTFWMTNVLTRIEEGEGKAGDADLLLEMGNNIDGRSFCPLGDASTWFPRSCIKYFRDEFEQHVTSTPAPSGKSGSWWPDGGRHDQVTLQVDGVSVTVPKGR